MHKDEENPPKSVKEFLTEIVQDAQGKNLLPPGKVFSRNESSLMPRGILKAVAQIRSLARVELDAVMLDKDQMDYIRNVLDETVILAERESKVDPERFEIKGIRASTVLAIAAYINSLGK